MAVNHQSSASPYPHTAPHNSSNDNNTMKPFTGATRTAFLIFFLSHIPITIFVDSQALLPAWLYPQAVQDLLDFYVSFVNDPLMARPIFAGPWFQSFVLGEFLFQLPFFCLAVRMMLSSQLLTWPDWFRTACIIYGTHTSTTLILFLLQWCLIQNLLLWRSS